MGDKTPKEFASSALHKENMNGEILPRHFEIIEGILA